LVFPPPVNETSHTNEQSEQQREADKRAAAEEAAKQLEIDRRKAAEQAAQNAAEAHAKFLARYLNSDFVRKPGSKTVFITVASEDGKFNRAVTAAVASRFKTESVETVSS